MGLLDIVNEDDEVIGQEDFTVIHSRGLRHRSVQVLFFQEDYNIRLGKYILVAERAKKQATSASLLHPPVGGHVREGQSYLEAAKIQTNDELFHGHNLPTEIKFNEISRYQNDTRETNKENTCLYAVVYGGNVYPNPNEIERMFWIDTQQVLLNIAENPDKFTQTFRNAMDEFTKKVKF